MVRIFMYQKLSFILVFADIKNIPITMGHSISNLETPQVTVLYWLAGLAGLASLATLLQLCVYSLCRWKSDWEWTLFALQSTSYGSIPTAPTFSNWIPFPSGLFPPIRDYDPHIDTGWEITKQSINHSYRAKVYKRLRSSFILQDFMVFVGSVRKLGDFGTTF